MIEDNLCFIVLCPELNTGGLKQTVSSIKLNFPNCSCLCVVGENATPDDLKEISKICVVSKAGATITSLINVGVNESKKKWCFIIMSGVLVRPTILKKYNYFLKDEKDILYSVVNNKTWTFDSATINGILLHKNAIKDIGNFIDEDSISNTKSHWGALALEKGYKLKGIVGNKI